MIKERFARSEASGHTIFLLENRSVIAPVAQSRSISLTAGFAFILVVLPLFVQAYTSPGRPQGFVSDFADVIPTAQRQIIEAKLTTLRQETSIEVAVATIPSLGDETIETYAEKLFQEWGIGGEARDTGLLILVAPNDRTARIEVGYGLEGDITDLQSGNIVRMVMIPAFQEGDYGAGIDGAVDAISAVVKDSPEAVQYSGTTSAGGSDNDYFGFLVLLIIAFNILAGILGKTKSWWLGGVLGAGLGAIFGLIWGWIPVGLGSIVGLSILGLIFDYIVSKHPPKGGGNDGGMWALPLMFMGGGHRGGGGFGGFGGGMSGGGGASGRW